MLPNWFWEKLAAERDMIVAFPIHFCFGVVFLSFIGWWILRWMYKERLDGQEHLIRLYKERYGPITEKPKNQHADRSQAAPCKEQEVSPIDSELDDLPRIPSTPISNKSVPRDAVPSPLSPIAQRVHSSPANQPDLKHQTTVAAAVDLSDSSEITFPDGIGIRVWFYCDSTTGSRGLLMAVINETTQLLKFCKGRVNGAKSFDSKRSVFIDDLLAHTLLESFGSVAHNNESGGQWITRICKGHLEIGNVGNQGILHWPSREPVAHTQLWILNISVEAEGVAAHEFTCRLEWARQADTIRVKVLSHQG